MGIGTLGRKVTHQRRTPPFGTKLREYPPPPRDSSLCKIVHGYNTTECNSKGVMVMEILHLSELSIIQLKNKSISFTKIVSNWNVRFWGCINCVTHIKLGPIKSNTLLPSSTGVQENTFYSFMMQVPGSYDPLSCLLPSSILAFYNLDLFILWP